MRDILCLIFGHRWTKERAEDGVYVRCRCCGAASITSSEYGTGGANASPATLVDSHLTRAGAQPGVESTSRATGALPAGWHGGPAQGDQT